MRASSESTPPQRRRLTLRAALALTFTSLLALTGGATILIVTVFMRTVPTYESSMSFTVTSTDPAADPSPTTTAADGANMMTQPTGLTLRSAGDILTTSLIVSIIVLVVIVAAGAIIAWVMAGRMLRPLQAVNAAAQRAGSGAFDHRIGLGGPHDEVRDLADTFDEMLERLERSFAASQRFAANASHELQTPLATTQTMLEVALADPDASAAELRAVSARVLETNRRSVETVSALLDLAELEQRTVDGHPTDLAGLARAAVQEQSADIAARGLTVHDDLPEIALVLGDEVLLRQAISNIVRNAVRHNVDHGWVRLTGSAGADGIVLAVENTGAALDTSTVASLAEPFVRAAGRIARDEGHGLGLAIVDSVMRAHGGELRLRARAGGGLVAELGLPAAGPAALSDATEPHSTRP